MSDLYKTDHHDGEIGLCNLGGIVVSKIETNAEYELAAYYALKMADRTIDLATMNFLIWGIQQIRRNAAIGMLGCRGVLR